MTNGRWEVRIKNQAEGTNNSQLTTDNGEPRSKNQAEAGRRQKTELVIPAHEPESIATDFLDPGSTCMRRSRAQDDKKQYNNITI